MYFDERNMDYKEENKSVDVDTNIYEIDTINIINNRNKIEIFGASEGLNKGNMFKDLYDPYKNNVFKIVVNTKKDKLLLIIQELNFKMIDLSLYLDINPSDKEVYSIFKETLKELKKNKEIYEKTYGPLCLENTTEKYNWPDNPWPWTMEGDNNV